MTGSLINLGADDGTLAIDHSDTVTWNTSISGSGGFAQIGTGTTIFTAAQDYTGNTTVANGTLELGAGGSLTSTATLAVSGGTFDLGTDNQTTAALTLTGGLIEDGTLTSTSFGVQAGTVSAVLGGSGALTKTGSGTVTLSGANTYSGGTTISAGTLQLGSGSNSGSLTGNVTDNATLADDRSDTLTWLTTISGSGAFTQIGTGITVFDVAESYGGGTTVSNGTLRLGVSGSLASAGALAVSGGTFDLGTDNQTTGALTLTGGLIENGTLDSASFGVQAGTVSAMLGGSGALTKTGSGTVTLSGANAYSGGTTIGAGMLQISGSGTLGGAVGTLAVSGGTLDLGATTQVSGALTLTGGVIQDGTLDSAAFGVQAGTVNAVFGGSGGLTKSGSGTVTLSAANAYGGGTMITAGTLQLGSGSNSGSLTGNVTDNATFVVDRSDTYAFAGSIYGSGVFEQLGSGTTILTASNTYTGGTTISAGTLQLGDAGNDGSIAGSVTDSTIFDIDDVGTTTLGQISGGGALNQVGSGTTILSAANNYAGGTTISAGTLQLGNGGGAGSLTGNITDNATLAVDRSDIYSFGESVFGTGAFAQIGTGTTILTAAQNYTGTTTVLAGTLQLGAGGSLPTAGNVAIDGGLLDLSGYNQTIGDLSGAGGFIALGSDTLTAGTTDSTAFAGAMFGSGAFVKAARA
jgi:fibronectin-binding autotransporter adhesin